MGVLRADELLEFTLLPLTRPKLRALVAAPGDAVSAKRSFNSRIDAGKFQLKAGARDFAP